MGCLCGKEGWVCVSSLKSWISNGLLLILVLHRFKGAYCSIWEKESLSELFGEMDVMDDTLPGMADKIIAHQASS